MPRLLFSRREAEAILALAARDDALRAFDFDANRAAATSPSLADYRIVHFATHAFLNATHPELSGIVLSRVDRQGRPQPGFLRLQDIYNLRLRADLVVLSACRTALGKDVRGEGLIGLARGFMYAGAPRVVATLWQVDDEATAEVMSRFYRGMLRDGLSPAAALRAAQLALRDTKRWRSPYYWAPFVLLPGLTRDTESLPRLLESRSSIIVLTLALEAGEVYDAYRVTVAALDGRQVWRQDLSRPQPAGREDAVIVSLPAARLASGHHVATLTGMVRGKPPETVGTYHFEVVR